MERIPVGRFYIAYASSSTVEPTAEVYEQLRAATEAYFEEFFAALFATDPKIGGLEEFTLDSTLHGDAAGIPEVLVNIYMEYSGAVFLFTPSPDNPNGRYAVSDHSRSHYTRIHSRHCKAARDSLCRSQRSTCFDGVKMVTSFTL
jgi:hypothetical protein